MTCTSISSYEYYMHCSDMAAISRQIAGEGAQKMCQRIGLTVTSMVMQVYLYSFIRGMNKNTQKTVKAYLFVVNKYAKMA